MNKGDFNIFHHLRKEDQENNVSFNLMQGLEDRTFGYLKKNAKTKENIEVFAEEQLVRKENFDEMRCEMPGLPRSTFLMVFSPDGSKVASTHGDHNIYVTDIRTGKNIKTLIGHPRTPWCIAFHPSLDQIVASGCLGGQVRIWDLSGGSEVWTMGSQSVIASIAFHPNDRILVIATYNEVYFWDWSQPEPFVHASTCNPKEKVRYVAFDKLGHKLITGIANSPQTRWERLRAPTPVPRQERYLNPYRRRLTQRLANMASPQQTSTSDNSASNRELPSGIPERERRISVCYRNLVREYEQLVQRYLQLYRSPTMVDRGTDPMEPSSSSFNSNSTQTSEASTSSTSHLGNVMVDPRTVTSTLHNPVNPHSSSRRPYISNAEPTISGRSVHTPSLPGSSSHSLLTPSRILSAIKKPKILLHATQTLESRKHTATGNLEPSHEKRLKKDNENTQNCIETSNNDILLKDCRADNTNNSSQTDQSKASSQISNPNIVSKVKTPRTDISSLSSACLNQPSTSGLQSSSKRETIKEFSGNIPFHKGTHQSNPNFTRTVSGTTDRRQDVSQNNVDKLLSNIRRTAEEEVRSRILPIIKSVPANDRPELIRLFENSREHVRTRFRQMCPILLRKPNSTNITETTSESHSSVDYNSNSSNNRLARCSSETACAPSDRSNSTSNTQAAINQNASVSSSSSSDRNFNIELEQLVTSLLTETERNETECATSNINCNSTESVENSGTNITLTDSSPSDAASLTRPSCNFQTSTSSMLGVQTNYSSSQDESQTQNLATDRLATSSSYTSTPSPSNIPVSLININTRTTNSVIYTSNISRRQFFSNRILAFMPTRVNYTRTPIRTRRHNHHTRERDRLGPQTTLSVPDELTNALERENAEDDLSQPQCSLYPFDALEGLPVNSDNVDIGNVYSNIVHDLESSLNDVRNIRASNYRLGETTNVLSSFSERLENIMSQSDTILRNLASSIESLTNTSESGSRTQTTVPTWTFFDQNFYVRDQSRDDVNSQVNTNDLINSRSPLNTVASDHTYPRIPLLQNDNVPSFMTSLHLTVSHIQRQARFLRQQVESIERIDKAMLEVAQLQLIKKLILELIEYVKSTSGENRSTEMSSVRQMMAGTRISDSSAYSSSTNESGTQNRQPAAGARNNSMRHTRHKGINRKTLPHSRSFRLARQCRRPSLGNFFSRRYMARSEAGLLQNSQRQSTSRHDIFSFVRNQSFPNHSIINSSTLRLMSRRLDQLLREQTRIFALSQEAPRNNRSTATVDLGEHILALRLHGSILRLTRVLGIQSNTFQNLRGGTIAAVTQDGVSRYGARHTLSLILDDMSRHMEDLTNTNFSQTVRVEIYGVLAMSMLLTDLLLLVIVDSIPDGMHIDPERESLTVRFNQMCGQMLQSRFSRHSNQLTRGLRLMRLTMRHAYRALAETYAARRAGMLQRPAIDRGRLVCSISGCLRLINRRWPRNLDREMSGERNAESQSDSNVTSNSIFQSAAWYIQPHGIVSDLVTECSTTNQENEANDQTSNNNREVPQSEMPSSNNDDDNNESEQSENNNSNNSTSRNNLYRAQSVGPISQSHPWNIPSVQVNDIPVTEPSVFTQRLISQRQRFAERVSELRSNSTMGLFRPRFRHPSSATLNSSDADLDDPQREQVYESDMITTVTPNHRLQAWDISDWNVPIISNCLKNIVVNECKIHNDASVDIAKDGTILVTLLPSGGYLNVTNRLGIYSLKWETLGQCLYTTSFEQNAVSVSLSPLSRHLVVGLASRRVSLVPNDRWVMARIFKIDQEQAPGDRLPVIRELEQNRDSRINCIRWLPTSGQGLIYATNTGQLVIIS